MADHSADANEMVQREYRVAMKLVRGGRLFWSVFNGSWQLRWGTSHLPLGSGDVPDFGKLPADVRKEVGLDA